MARALGQITASCNQETPDDEASTSLHATTSSETVVSIDNALQVIVTAIAWKDEGSSCLTPPVQTSTNDDWRGWGTRPKFSAAIQAQTVTTITSSTNTRPTAIQQS